jgi:hypothetical protein
LILVDWDLQGGLKGQDVIYEIRSTIQYKDVVFYSSLTSVQELRGLAYKIGVEGVYCASKLRIVDEVMGVFESLVKKVLDIDHTRGIVMGATSDIDRMVHECLARIHDQSDVNGKKFLLIRAKKIISDRIEDLSKKANELQKTDNVAKLLEAHALFGANDRLRVLSAALETKGYEEHGSLRDSLKSYITDVVPMRNDLGHVVLIPDGATGALSEVTGKPITLDEMRELRRFLLELRADFRLLRNILNSA